MIVGDIVKKILLLQNKCGVNEGIKSWRWRVVIEDTNGVEPLPTGLRFRLNLKASSEKGYNDAQTIGYDDAETKDGKQHIFERFPSQVWFTSAPHTPFASNLEGNIFSSAAHFSCFLRRRWVIEEISDERIGAMKRTEIFVVIAQFTN